MDFLGAGEGGMAQSSSSEELLSLPRSPFRRRSDFRNSLSIRCLYWFGWYWEAFFRGWDWSMEPRLFRALGISARMRRSSSMFGISCLWASGATTGCNLVGLRGRGAGACSEWAEGFSGMGCML